MSTATLERPTQTTALPELNAAQLKNLEQTNNGLLFKFFTFNKLPLGLLSGMKIKEFNRHRCVATIPYGWMTRNPFKSTFWAAQGMAAELSTGVLALLATAGHQPSVAVILVGCSARFHKKAVGLTYFTCEEGDALFAAVQKARDTGESVEQTVQAIGTDKDGNPIATFEFTWSFKQRSK